MMLSFLIEYWWREGDDKFHDWVEIEAKDEEEAHHEIKSLSKNIFKTITIRKEKWKHKII